MARGRQGQEGDMAEVFNHSGCSSKSCSQVSKVTQSWHGVSQVFSRALQSAKGPAPTYAGPCTSVSVCPSLTLVTGAWGDVGPVCRDDGLVTVLLDAASHQGCHNPSAVQPASEQCELSSSKVCSPLDS